MNEKKKASPADKMVNIIIGLVIIAFIAAGGYATYGKIAEGIETKAIESGEKEATVSYLAKQAGMTVEDYLAQYGLTVGDTVNEKSTQTEMEDNMTVENYLSYTGDTQDVDELISGMGLEGKATKDTLWKDFLPMAPAVSVIGGEEAFNQAKEQLGLGDEVTTDITWGDFQKLMEEKQNEAAEATEAPAEATAEAAEATEAPAAE